MREEEFIDWMDDKELKYVIFWGGENNEVLGVVLNCGADTLKEVLVKRDFSRGRAIIIAVCNCPHTSDTHTENS